VGKASAGKILGFPVLSSIAGSSSVGEAIWLVVSEGHDKIGSRRETMELIQFFNHTIPSHFDRISPIIQEMVYSSLDDISKEGAIQVTAHWLFHGFFEKELQTCQTGTIPQRQVIAIVASHFLCDKKKRPIATKHPHSGRWESDCPSPYSA